MTQPYRPDEIHGELYEDRAGLWRFRVRHSANGKILEASTESYGTEGRPDLGKRYAREMFRRLHPTLELYVLEAAGPELVDDDEETEGAPES